MWKRGEEVFQETGVIRGGVWEKNTLRISSDWGYLSDDVKMKNNKEDLDAVTRVHDGISHDVTIKTLFDSLNIKYDLLLIG